MNQILKPGQTVRTESSGINCRVEEFLGGGGQGEVYRVTLGDRQMALKWFFPHYVKIDRRLRARLETAIKTGCPSDRFLWPIELASAKGVPEFGYIMPLREARFKGLHDLMRRRVEPSFRALATAGFELADSFWHLHSKGLCYRDISFGNVFLDPTSGEVRVCDNDNVDVDGRKGWIGGTPRFMAPEIVRGETYPSTQTDLFSLAVLLFYIFIMHHPLDGRREAEIRCMDVRAMTKLYGTEPLFIFNPDDSSNEPVPGYHDNALELWPIYPQFLRDLFTRSFTNGIRDPLSGRVRETEWKQGMIRLRDLIVCCPNCREESLHNPEAKEVSDMETMCCWSCEKQHRVPLRIRIGHQIVILNHDTRLFPHHVDRQRMYDFSTPIAKVTQHPRNPNVWGLKNLSEGKWTAVVRGEETKEVDPGRSIALAPGTKIHFGRAEGEIVSR
jgi:serine/threonine protein kinase